MESDASGPKACCHRGEFDLVKIESALGITQSFLNHLDQAKAPIARGKNDDRNV